MFILEYVEGVIAELTLHNYRFIYAFEGLDILFICTAMDIIMRRFITSESEMSVQWVGFESKADMMLYYIAVADSPTARPEDCKHYVSI